MYETLLRPQEVTTISPLRPISEAVDKLRKSEQRREEKRQRQIAGSKRKREDGPIDDEETPGERLDVKR
jgi:tRNA (adenine57-N1/adenine58-N1)-methyltransferase